MATLYGYKNKLWEVYKEFSYTGSPEEFSLNPGKYLLICKGARGGAGAYGSSSNNLGGTSYGVLKLSEKKDLYAVVGGDGGNSNSDKVTVGPGGYNGGGDGGKSTNNNYPTGAGGGGGTDIRLNLDGETEIVIGEYEISDDYEELEYIENTGNTGSYLNTGYIHKANTKIVCDCMVYANTSRSWEALYGSRASTVSKAHVFFVRFSSSNIPCYSSNTAETRGNGMVYSKRITVETYNTLARWFDDGTMVGSITSSTQVDGTQPMYIFDLNNAGSVDNSTSHARIYSFKIYEGSTLVRCYVPAKRLSDNAIGLCDIITNTFITNSTLSSGEPVEEKTSVRVTAVVNQSLLSRIIVAGGAGGGQNMVPSTSYANYTAFGGGVNGGFPHSNPTATNYTLVAGQTSGYSFGTGMNGLTRTSGQTWSCEGSAGGGGGWYGGYSDNNTGDSYQCGNAGGGSGYVLTESSYKPYGDQNSPGEEWYLTDTTMTAGTADVAGIIICTESSQISNGDTVIFPTVGEGCAFTLPKGEYTVKCWGGNGSARYGYQNAAKGGYAQGTFTNPERQTAYAYVGGSGTYGGCAVKGSSYLYTTFPQLGFNGGGGMNNFTSSFQAGGMLGGGGTDLRIGTDSYYSRIIVAGGAGGCGAAETSGNRYGGAGGGTSGSLPTVTGYGTSNGPGTQTSSPSSASATVAGGFGYGGLGLVQSGGYGGAGGGGWFGGSGNVPDGGSDDDAGGSGGSGYVLTEESYKPDGYLLDSRYYMTDTTLTTGGNTLPYGITKIEIDCIKADNNLILAHDAEGYKGYNTETEQWEEFSTEFPTVDDFTTYGVYSIENDNNLLTDYELIVYDENNLVNTAVFNVIPSTQKIKLTKYADMLISEINYDIDYDPDAFSVDIQTHRSGILEDAHVDITITVDQNKLTDVETRLYCIMAYCQGTASSYHVPKKKEKTIDHIDLLPVGIGNRMPARYKSYISSPLPDGSAVASVQSAMSCERNRNIYSCLYLNSSYIRFTKLNLITNKSIIIKDIPKANISDTVFGGFLVDDDYMYLTSANNNNVRTIWRIPVNPDDNTITSYAANNSADNNFNAYGKMVWYDKTHIVIGYRRGFAIFDTKKLTYEYKYNSNLNSARNEIVIGKKLWFSHYAGTGTNFWIYDYENNRWFTSDDSTYGLGEALQNNGWICGCYNDGKFYLSQKNWVYVIDEETCKIESKFNTPYTSLDPKSIEYSEGVLYITIANSPTLYIYDMANQRWTSTGLRYTTAAWGNNNMCRQTAFSGYYFYPNLQLYVINFVEYAKYNMGFKFEQYNFVLNSEYLPTYTRTEYDNRFVTFTDSNMWVHPGNIEYTLEPSVSDQNIKITSINKNEYKQLISVNLIKINEEVGD